MIRKASIFVKVLFLVLCSNAQAQKHNHNYERNQVRIVLGGEMNLGNNYSISGSNTNVNTPKETDEMLSVARPILQKADVSIVSLGTVFADEHATPNRSNATTHHTLIRMPESAAVSLSGNGITAVSMSGSHLSDFGLDGLLQTSSTLEANNIEIAGVKGLKVSTIFEKDGVKYGLASFGNTSHSTSMGDTTLVKNIVQKLKASCDIVIVAFTHIDRLHSNSAIVNGADNREDVRINNLRLFAHTCIEAGADLVYGAGSSALQPIELYNDKLIVYGLGYFFTPAGVNINGNNGCAPLLEVTLTSDGYFDKGHINSLLQHRNAAMTVDPANRAATLIRTANEQYVTNNELDIQPNGEIISLSRSPNMQAMKIIEEGKRHLGKRYVHGTAGPNTFDCSGFTSYIFGKFGYNLSRSSQVQYTQGTPVDRRSLRPGDLVFFKGRTSSGVGHVGMVVNVDAGRNSFQFIHASSTRGIMITDFSTSAYYIRRYVGAKRIIK